MNPFQRAGFPRIPLLARNKRLASYLTVLNVLLTARQGSTHGFGTLRTQPDQVAEGLHHHYNTAGAQEHRVRTPHGKKSPQESCTQIRLLLAFCEISSAGEALRTWQMDKNTWNGCIRLG